jgi:predicted Fe-S protein YdhL (DUF1289 family)
MSGSQPPSPSIGPPMSPCTKVCVLDAAQRQCTGCARTVDEIARWWSMRDDEKRTVLAQLPQRRG